MGLIRSLARSKFAGPPNGIANRRIAAYVRNREVAGDAAISPSAATSRRSGPLG